MFDNLLKYPGAEQKIYLMKKYLCNHDITILAETIIEEKNISSTTDLLPSSHKWIWTNATRKNRKGRAMGGMLCGIRKTFRINKTWISPSGNVISVEINIQSQKTQIVGVYNAEGLNAMKKEIECQWLENPNRTIIIGDWNARAGVLGSIDSLKRFTKDITTIAEGKTLVEFIQMMGMVLLNGHMEADWEGEFTHDGSYNLSVIDYASASIELMNELKTFNIHQILEWDHHPLIVSWSSDPIMENEEELVRRVKTAARRGLNISK